ncbi:hypothetical protein HMPREF3185_01015 [Porphyromonas somerae]|uniref:Uncharacterized protein n=1 Tax=Porphyromonas somerae TaxID=322095 RepID=A0A134B8N7_9PORP|nr:hypothetical protein HMPREF3184_01015 [Porphyromonadaceae bacterium KA00676]KXB76307.1 hypothetical protein HMPREF3185_01015 [Porphyromonas somerae]
MRRTINQQISHPIKRSSTGCPPSRPLHKAIPSQLTLFSFELLSLKPPIFEERRYE